jgi:hypothetical protein
MRAFVRKGRMSDMMTAMPVHVIVRPAAILGAAIRGLELGSTPTGNGSASTKTRTTGATRRRH